METARIRIQARGPVRPSSQTGREPVLPPNPGWMDQAACNGTDDPVFFESKNEPGKAKAAAILYCNSCPVRVACLAYALKTHSHGIWAGTTMDQRKRLARHRRRAKCPVCTCETMITAEGSEICLACGVSWMIENRPKSTEQDNDGHDDR